VLLTESRRYSYIRGARDVARSEVVNRYLARAKRIGAHVLGYKDSTFLAWPGLPVQGGKEVTPVVREGVGLVAARVVEDATDLRLIQFERFAPPRNKFNALVNRLYVRIVTLEDMQDDAANDDQEQSAAFDLYRAKLTKLVKKYQVNPYALEMHTDRVEFSRRTHVHGFYGELALRMQPSPTVDFVLEQNQLLYDAVKSTGPGAELCIGQAPINEVEVPFMWLPKEATAEQREDVVGLLQTNLSVNGLMLEAGPLVWKPRTLVH